MNNLQIFKNENFGEVRTLIIDGEPWFVGKDVCTVFGDSNYRRSLERLDKDEKGVSQIETPGGKQKMIVINEPGLFSLLFYMQPQKAKGVTQNDDLINERIKKLKEFKRWVTHDVLPAIRKTGSYTRPKDTIALLELELKAIKEVSAKLDDVNSDLQQFKTSIPLFAVECEELTHAVNCKIIALLGGKDTTAYKDNHFRGTVYSDIYREIKRQFGVKSYKAIKRSDINLAISIIKEYKLPIALQQELLNFENQISIN